MKSMFLLLAALLAPGGANHTVLTGPAAWSDYRNQKPGTFRKITVADLPRPYATKSAGNGPDIVPRPANAWPKTLPGFRVDLFASGLDNPRLARTAPNGDIFVAATGANRIHVFRGITADGKAKQSAVFAERLRQPFGIAFYPPGKDPQWIYIANTDSVVRYPYRNGDLAARGASETLVKGIPTGGHTTRDLVFSPDGSKMYVSVGSRSNVSDDAGEFHRASILEYTPEGKFVRVYASGIRNPVGIAFQPGTDVLWCSVNERDELGDNLVPDYITHVEPGGFYGWPWYYIGSHQDPRHAGKHPELKGKVIVPDVLLQPHFASLQMTFYEGSQFPKEYHGDIFAAEHGSWNRGLRTGYEVIRVPLEDGKATGEFEEFLTGFVMPDGSVWGRPVGVTVAPDGSLLVTDDGSGSIWRVSYTGQS